MLILKGQGQNRFVKNAYYRSTGIVTFYFNHDWQTGLMAGFSSKPTSGVSLTVNWYFDMQL